MICPSCRAENDESAEVCFTCGKGLAAVTKGSVIAGRYEVLSPLGRGGMGMVYKAHDRALDETVALKVLRSDFARTPEMAQRFRSEIKLARKVSHRNVCRIHEYGEDGGLRYLCMEFIDGVDLMRAVRDRAGLPFDEAYDVAIQVAEGLQAIHSVGIIHRDLKTANVMRDTQGVARLGDFGLAKQFGAEAAGELSAVGSIVGTPEYMSPEQARGQKVDFRSDIYSLGIVIYEIFTGRVPFHGDTPVATLLKHSQEPPPVDERIPSGLVPVLRKALAKDPEERYATVRGLIAALKLARATSQPDTKYATRPATTAPAKALLSGPAARDTLAPPPAETQLIAKAPLPDRASAPPSGAPGSALTDKLQALFLALKDENVLVRWRTALALADMGSAAKAAVPALLEALHDPATSVADAAAAALKKIAGRPMTTPAPAKATDGVVPPPALAAAAKALRDEDPSARWRTVMALGEMGPAAEGAVPLLVEALDDGDESVRWAAAVSLGKIGPAAKDAVQPLAAALNERDDNVIRQHAAAALGRIGPSAKEAIPALIGALRDREAEVRDEATRTLVMIGPAAVPALIEALKDDHDNVRWKAADALMRIATAP